LFGCICPNRGKHPANLLSLERFVIDKRESVQGEAQPIGDDPYAADLFHPADLGMEEVIEDPLPGEEG
jgi:hypothetical protein